MKIGIVTYHKANNYGAVLQAVALYKYLKTLNNNVYIIDYWPIRHAAIYKAFMWNSGYFHSLSAIKRVKYFLKSVILSIKRKRRICKFDKYRAKHMELCSVKRNSFDGVFYGSDTIWNIWKYNDLFSGFDEVYWGSNYIKSKCKFSYAPSMGDVVNTDESRQFCKNQIANFNKVSVRESQLLNFLISIGVSDVCKVVDPTCLLTTDDWKQLSGERVIKGEYILCYNLEHSPIISEAAEQLGHLLGLRVIQLTDDVEFSHSLDVFDLAGPQEFLSLYRDASYVLTSSFHGVVFSILYNKNFWFNNQNETERIVSLLTSTGLSERYIKDLGIDLTKPIDFESVNVKMDRMRLESKLYIDKCLQMIQ